ncbi:COQ9 family protein [Geminicoccus flavidas]|uniref:COQ9 family protein n=1 Tax=Geminicoccus flavidas TaxID=2506407 RepID=UPI0013595AE4|nr:COQ9 family protein [Geminicoccus flavidas]
MKSDEALALKALEKDRLFEMVLQHVPFDGWGSKSLQAAAADLGMTPITARRLFPQGQESLLAWLGDWLDRQAAKRLASEDLERLRIRQRIARLVAVRLEVLARHKEAMRRAVAAGALPRNLYATSRRIWAGADDMWRMAGDQGTSRELDYWTRRGLLSAVWVSTFLFWLEDRSEGDAETRAFLDRRIDNVMAVARLKGRVENMVRGLPGLRVFLREPPAGGCRS